MALLSRPTLEDLGYAGIGRITSGGTDFNLYLTSGNFSFGLPSRVYQTMADVSGTQVTQVIHSDGVVIYNISMSWDFSIEQAVLVSRFINKGNTYHVYLYDGDLGKKGLDVHLESFTINGAVNSLVTATASFVSGNMTDWAGAGAIDKTEQLVAYWHTGTDTEYNDLPIDVIDWSLSVTHEVTPRYYNSASNLPERFHKATTRGEFSVTTFTDITDFLGVTPDIKVITLPSEMKTLYGPYYHHLNIGVGDFTVKGFIAAKAYDFGGADNTGTYNYTLETAQVAGSSGSGSVQHLGGNVDTPVLIFTYP